jgi:hypothetical protein
MAMADSVSLFPNMLQPAVLKTYAPVGVKFWEGEDAVLSGLREFSEGWFARRHTGTQAALEAAKRIGEAATAIDVLQAYQDWANGAAARLLEDGLAYQTHLLKAGSQLGALPPAAVKAEAVAVSNAVDAARQTG